MSFGVFVHRTDSIYDDSPAERYQFPRSYLSRAKTFVGNWVLYYEPVKVPGSRGYFAVAQVAGIVPDRKAENMYVADIEPGSYLEFPTPVPFRDATNVMERGLLNHAGAVSGRAQAAVRPISQEDFHRILDRGLEDESDILPRTETGHHRLREEPVSFGYEERPRIASLTSRVIRDRAFRKVVLRAYGERCAITGLRLINGGGRAEAEAAHIQPVEHHGPDIVTNGLALSGTVHWMFDRGLISLSNELKVLISRQANDPDGIRAMINPTGHALPPVRALDRPHPHFLQWHREQCFKH